MMMNPFLVSAVYAPAPGPPPGAFGNVPGYENMAGGGFLPPPVPLQPLAPVGPPPNQQEWSIPCISEEVAREAFKDYASSNCCYSNSPAEDGVITSLEPHNTYRYRLETFTESRSTDWAHKPHKGEAADFYTQPAPQPWQVQVTPPEMFTNHTEELPVPYTSTIKDCHTCKASGTTQCDQCNGVGSKECYVCHGTGKTETGDCGRCNAGRESCSSCNGQGTEDCETCEGRRQLMTFIQLKVEWTNHLEDFLAQQGGGLTAQELSSVTGKELFKGAQNLVYPMLGFPDPAIAQASERMVQEHQAQYLQTSRILQQRQTVELIPVAKVGYKWKGDAHCYYVAGNELHVTADYPDTCCCVIL
ncbi:protein SSUH2 homolog isoform X2 [Gadus chalcogrammus]|uniref:protein SSUH2 homolog isoform X2 n=1 Tax=Gadus chalcogrammus TaxID=1042646 RepID=UPI0024C48594|nr:protein SSUH2 homolog isoform X2 [Gadus chalcogrammus]